jgi:uncharacterized membrane-anchored protein
MNNKGVLMVLVIFQLAVIAGMLLKAMLPLWTGKEIELRVTPRDPRDIFRGDYVALTYEFSRVNLDSLPNDIPEDAEFFYGDVLFVELKPSRGYYVPAGVWMSPPQNDVTFLKAIVEYNVLSRQFSGGGQILDLKCGIESYFTDRETARKMEEQLRNRVFTEGEEAPSISVTVMVAPGGEARIKRVSYHANP